MAPEGQGAENAEAFENTYFDTISKTKLLIDDNSTESITRKATTPASQTSNNINIKLPTIQLPSFDGTFTLWREFFDAFNSLMHLNSDLTDMQKLSYLRLSLKGCITKKICEYKTNY